MTSAHTTEAKTAARPSLDEMAEIVANLSTYEHTFYKVDFDISEPEYIHGKEDTRTRVELGPEADVISSEIADQPGWHTVMLDIDGPVHVSRDGVSTLVGIDVSIDPFRPGQVLGDLLRHLRGSGIATRTGLHIPPGGQPVFEFRPAANVRLVESSTLGHHHLFVDARVRSNDWMIFLAQFAAVGIIELGYAEASRIRGAAHLRLPWIQKPGAK